MKVSRIAMGALATMWLGGTCAQAHGLFITAVQSLDGHYLTTLNFGHRPPQDSLLASDSWALALSTYQLHAPDGTIMPLPLPDLGMHKGQNLGGGVSIVSGDLGARQISIEGQPAAGVYQISASTLVNYTTQYVNKEGKETMADKPVGEIADLVKTVESYQTANFAKAFLPGKEWLSPKPIGHTLEIVPLSNLSKARAGDVVKFQVLLFGHPFTPRDSDHGTVTIDGSALGRAENSAIQATWHEGVAQFRLPAAGQWIVAASSISAPTDLTETASLVGKVTAIVMAATYTFESTP